MRGEAEKMKEDALISTLQSALDELRRDFPNRRRAAQHLETAIKCLRDPKKHIHPTDLNSANDG